MAQISLAVPWTPNVSLLCLALVTCSGLAKAGLATVLPQMSSPGFSNTAETPKSTILQVLRSAVNKILSGLMS